MWATEPATHVDRTAATERRVGRRRVARQMLRVGLLSNDQSIKTAINVVVLSVTPW